MTTRDVTAPISFCGSHSEEERATDPDVRYPCCMALALREWIDGGSGCQRPDVSARAVADLVYTLSEGGTFEEGTVSTETAVLCWRAIERLVRAGELPERFRL